MTGARHAGPVRTEDRDTVRILWLAKANGNALDTKTCRAIESAASDAEADPAVRAIVLASAVPGIFCAGFDLKTLGPADESEFLGFARTFDTLFLELFLLDKPVVAALAGHAVAGGTLLAAAADFRVAAEGPGRIGLTAARMGILVPRHCVEAMRAVFPPTVLSRWLLAGETIAFAEALALGAVDRLVPPERVLDEAVSFAARLGETPPEVYGALKRDLRGPAADAARGALAEGRKAFVDSWFAPEGRAGIASALVRLGAGGRSEGR